MNFSQKIRNITNPAGGLFYHYCALKYRHSRWKTFREPLNEWLLEWDFEHEDLLIVGSSGGYSLSDAFLMRFKSITIIEPDPIARFIFLKRFEKMGIPIHHDPEDYFSPEKNDFQPSRLQDFFKKYQTHSIVFSNLLGQFPHLFPKAAERESFKFWKKILRRELDQRFSWLSYHDRISSRYEFKLSVNIMKSSQDFTNSELVESLEWANQSPRAIQIGDHQTGDLFQGMERRYFVWRIFPGQCHLVEGARRDRPAF